MTQTRTWTHESPARWDSAKARIIAEAQPGIFDSRYRSLALNALVPGEWWRVEANGRVVGFGWLDVSFGDAEVLLATEVEARRHGHGRFIIEQLDREARARGLNYLTNIVRPTHPYAAEVTAFLVKQGFVASEDGRLLRPVSKS